MWIYSPYITKNGKRLYASTYGFKVFRFWVDDDKVRESNFYITCADQVFYLKIIQAAGSDPCRFLFMPQLFESAF